MHHELSPGRAASAAVGQTAQRQITGNFVDNRATAVRQRKMQQLADANTQSTVQFKPRTGAKRVLHAIRHPWRAFKHRNNQAVEDTFADDFIATLNKRSEEGQAKEKLVQSKMSHAITTVSPTDAKNYINQLEAWLHQVQDVLKEHKAAWEPTAVLYQDTTIRDIQEEDSRQKVISFQDYTGAENEITEIIAAIRSGRNHYVVATKDNELQGIMQVDSEQQKHIYNIAINPNNIDKDNPKRVSRTLQDLLGFVFTTNTRNKTNPTLVALNKRIRGIYEHYGFEDTGGRMDEMAIPADRQQSFLNKYYSV